MIKCQSDIIVLHYNVLKEHKKRIFGYVNMQEKRNTVDEINAPVCHILVGMMFIFDSHTNKKCQTNK